MSTPAGDEHRLGGEMSLASRVLYAVLRAAIEGVARIYLRLEVIGKEHLPRQGPYIVAPIHRSNLDTPILGTITTRRLRYMGKDSVWKYRASAWLMNTLGGFPVRRGKADRAALSACIAVIERGEPLVMFPEGTRQSGPTIVEPFDGPAFVACRTGAPIVPVGIAGTDRAMPVGARFIRPTKVVIVVGEPVVPPPRPEGGRVPRRVVREVTEELAERIQALYDEALRRAGVPVGGEEPVAD